MIKIIKKIKMMDKMKVERGYHLKEERMKISCMKEERKEEELQKGDSKSRIISKKKNKTKKDKIQINSQKDRIKLKQSNLIRKRLQK